MKTNQENLKVTESIASEVVSNTTDDLTDLIECTALNTIKSAFDGKDSEWLETVWKNLRNALVESEHLDDMRSKRDFKNVIYTVNYVIDCLLNSKPDKYETIREHNHFLIALHLTAETVKKDQSYLRSFSFLLEIMDQLIPQNKYWFEEEINFSILFYDLRTIEHALKFTTEMRIKHLDTADSLQALIN